eukprot:PhM_4_TR4796/c0_g1_i1/m.47544
MPEMGWWLKVSPAGATLGACEHGRPQVEPKGSLPRGRKTDLSSDKLDAFQHSVFTASTAGWHCNQEQPAAHVGTCPSRPRQQQAGDDDDDYLPPGAGPAETLQHIFID